MLPPRSMRRLLMLAAVALVPACGGTDPMEPDPNGGDTGSVQVTATTTGSDLDSGYRAEIGALGASVSANGSGTIANVPVGSASVSLTGIAANCAVTSANPVNVTVVADQTVDADFAVVCEAAGDFDEVLADAIEALEEAMFTLLNSESLDDLDDVSFADANELFLLALDIDGSSDVAAFGAAVTTIFVLEDNEDLRQIAEDWEAWIEELDEDDSVLPTVSRDGVPAPFSWERGQLPLDVSFVQMESLSRTGMAVTEVARSAGGPMAVPPDISGYRDVLLDIIVPALEEALEHLEEIDDPDFEFAITPAMQGEEPDEADELELDLTEVLLLRGGLDVAIAAVKVMTSYRIDPSPLGAEEFVTAMTPGSTFLQLHADGDDLLEDALARLRDAAAVAQDALDNLEAETDDQSDDILKIDPDGDDGPSQDDLDQAREVIVDVEDALFNPTDITIDEGEDDEFTFTLDAKQFFLNPRPDLKAIVPEYEVFTATADGQTIPVLLWDALNLDEWEFPDPTFGGVFPGMTHETLWHDLQFAELFFEFSVAEGFYRLITVDGVDCVAVYEASGTGCAVDGGFVRGGYVEAYGSDRGPRASFSYYGTSSFYASGEWSIGGEVSEDEYDLILDLDDVSGPVDIDALLIYRPGFEEVDEHHRERGGSIVQFTYMDVLWVFERDD